MESFSHVAVRTFGRYPELKEESIMHPGGPSLNTPAAAGVV
jgi:hypothetical protein